MQGSFNELILIHSLISSSAFPALHVLSTPLYITSAKPEKFLQAVTLTVSSSFPCLDYTDTLSLIPAEVTPYSLIQSVIAYI